MIQVVHASENPKQHNAYSDYFFSVFLSDYDLTLVEGSANLIGNRAKVEKINTKSAKMEGFEPRWMLDRLDCGSLYWRRDNAGDKSRVKFRYDVEVKEFRKGEHEDMVADWIEYKESSSNLTMGMTAILCVMITVFLPWYIIGIN
ncbi:hypothetical protein RN001_015125 [Aquatica leii]|uniref:Uncharacterized protein n=1 Tax=Aquatica leii TaxID=1421715 RepID=A0AAN7P2X8_9COLE|nr:hypothetical protein RN001_015125 [Aquatica leii]